MAGEGYYEEGSRVLSLDQFELVLANELKRALRSQNFLTLVVLDARRESAGEPTTDEAVVRDLTHIVSREIRETDPMTRMQSGLAMVLLDADLEQATRVIARLMARIDHYEFYKSLTIAFGAACCPTQAADARSLIDAASSRPLVTRRKNSPASH